MSESGGLQGGGSYRGGIDTDKLYTIWGSLNKKEAAGERERSAIKKKGTASRRGTVQILKGKKNCLSIRDEKSPRGKTRGKRGGDTARFDFYREETTRGKEGLSGTVFHEARSRKKKGRLEGKGLEEGRAILREL